MFIINSHGPYHCIHCAYSQNSSICRYYGGHKKTGSLNLLSPSQNSFQIKNLYENSSHNTGSSIVFRRTFTENQLLLSPNHDLTNHLQTSNKRGSSDDVELFNPKPTAITNHQPTDQIKHLRLTQCLRCDQLVDDYIQLDNCILFLDAVLQKTSFYRHIILNCSINLKTSLRILILFSLCDAYRRWTLSFGFNASPPIDWSTIIDQLFSYLNGQNAATVHNSTSTEILTKKDCARNVHKHISNSMDFHDPNKMIFGQESYLELEFSFYLSFLATLMSNLSFYSILFWILWLAQRSQFVKLNRRSLTFATLLPDLITCSYGKLFTLPAILWGDQLRSVIDLLIQIFISISHVQCCYVYTKNSSRFRAIAIVSVAILLHHTLCLVSVQLLTNLMPRFRHLALNQSAILHSP